MMFAIQYYRSYVKNDGLMTSHKESARLFDTEKDAQDYLIHEWLKAWGDKLPATREPVFIVEVETKQVLRKVKQIVGSF